MTNNEDRVIIAGKCRCCDNIEIWDFGEASDKQQQLLNSYVLEGCKNYCKNSYCENCEGIVLFDILFYGIKSKLQKAIENLKIKYSNLK